MTMKNDFAKIVKDTRLRRGWTQTELGRRCGVTKSAISHIEAGRRTPTMKYLCALADAFDCSTDYLMGRGIHTPVPVRHIVEELIYVVGNLKDEDREALERVVTLLLSRARDPRLDMQDDEPFEILRKSKLNIEKND